MVILLKNCSYLVQDSMTVLKNVDLLVEGTRIKDIGAGLEAKAYALSKSPKMIDASGKVVMPGLVNAHTHLYQCLLKGVRDDLPFKKWCEKVTFPMANIVHKEHREYNDIELGYWWAMVGAIEMVKSGTTSFVDMDLTLDSIFQAWLDIGIRGIAAITVTNRWIPKNLSRGEEARKKEVLSYLERWCDPDNNRGLVKVFIAPSAPFACTPKFMEWVYQVAEQYDLGMQMHISENLWELETSIKETGYPPLEYLARYNLLKRPFSAVHCVCLREHELELLKAHDLPVVYNPKSNMKLGSGVAPVVKMLDKGITVALATDGPASNDLLDMFEEMRIGALLQKVHHHDPSVISADKLLEMATVNGAKVAQVDAGVLAPGKLADIIILNLRQAHSLLLHDIVQTVVYCAKGSDVEMSIINGKVIMENRKLLTIDEDEMLAKAFAYAKTKLVGWDDRGLAPEF